LINNGPDISAKKDDVSKEIEKVQVIIDEIKKD